MTKRVRTIRAIQPNAGVTSWYFTQLQRLLLEMSEDLQRTIEKPADVALAVDDGEKRWDGLSTSYTRRAPWRVETIVFDGQVWDAASPNARLNKALKKWGDKWAAKFEKTANKLAKQFATKSFQATQQAFRAALQNADFTVRFAPTRASLEAFRATVAENVGLIRSIGQQYHTKIQGDVWRAVTRGSDLSTLSLELRNTYGVTVKRAALIARDQNAKAKATIENTRREELGITQAIWQHSSAGKEPRPAHVAMNGKLFDLAKGMWDEDEQQWILPGQLINCRCTSRAIVPGFES